MASRCDRISKLIAWWKRRRARREIFAAMRQHKQTMQALLEHYLEEPVSKDCKTTHVPDTPKTQEPLAPFPKPQ